MNVSVTLTDPTDAAKTAQVASHPTDTTLTVFTVGGQSITLTARELEMAIRNSTNVIIRKPSVVAPK